MFNSYVSNVCKPMTTQFIAVGPQGPQVVTWISSRKPWESFGETPRKPLEIFIVGDLSLANLGFPKHSLFIKFPKRGQKIPYRWRRNQYVTSKCHVWLPEAIMFTWALGRVLYFLIQTLSHDVACYLLVPHDQLPKSSTKSWVDLISYHIHWYCVSHLDL